MGFLGKFYVLAAGAAASAWALMLVLAVTSVAGLFYYLRILVTLYSAPAEHAALIPALARASAVVLGMMTIAVIWFGVYPAPLLDLIRTVIGPRN
jgi:NADH-quinone oxidoreductase subunit N